MKSTYTTEKIRRSVELNTSGVADLIGTTSGTSFTQPATFGEEAPLPSL